MNIRDFILKFGISTLEGQKVIVDSSVMTIELNSNDLDNFDKENHDAKYWSFEEMVKRSHYRFMAVYKKKGQMYGCLIYPDSEVII